MPLFRDDRLLLDAFKQRNQDVLTKVYYFYVDEIDTLIRNGFLESHSRSRVPGITDRETQRELVQEIFAKAFSPSGLHSYDGIRPYKSYLRTIAINVLLDHFRRRRHDPLTLSVLKKEDADRESTSPNLPPEIENRPAVNDHQVEDGASRVHWQRALAACETFVKNLSASEQKLIHLRPCVIN